MNVVKKMVYQISAITLVVSLILFVIALFFENIFISFFSILLSTVASLISFYLIVYSTANVSKMVSNSYTYYILRLIINGLSLVIGLFLKLNLVLLILGLFTHKIAIVIYGVCFKGGQ